MKQHIKKSTYAIIWQLLNTTNHLETGYTSWNAVIYFHHFTRFRGIDTVILIQKLIYTMQMLHVIFSVNDDLM